MAVGALGRRYRGVLLPSLLLSLLLAAPSGKDCGGRAMAAAVTVGVEEDAEETRKGSEGTSESWTTWAKDKISGGLGLKQQQQQQEEQEEEEEAARKTAEAAKSERDKAQEMAWDTGCYTMEKAAKAERATKEKTEKAEKTAAEATENAKASAADVTEKAAREAKHKAAEAGEQLLQAKDRAEEKAKEGYEAAKAKAGETLDAAKETLVSEY